MRREGHSRPPGHFARILGQTGLVTSAAGPARDVLLRRGFALEYVTLAWNVAGIVVLAVAAVAARSVALAGFGLDSLIEIGASTVVVWELSGAGAERQRRGLRLIGYAFAALAVYLLAQSTVVLAAGLPPAALGARDHLDGGDRRGHVRARRGQGPDRPGAGQSGAADRGPGHDDRRDSRCRRPGGPGAECRARLVVGRPGRRVRARLLRRPRGRGKSSWPAHEEPETQNLLCACLAMAVFAGLAANALLGAWWLDGGVALGISGWAVVEGRRAWNGRSCGCVSDNCAR